MFSKYKSVNVEMRIVKEIKNRKGKQQLERRRKT